MTNHLNHVSAISLFVEDVAATKAFYIDVFGAPVVYEDAVSAALKFDTLIVNLLHTGSAPEIIAPGVVAPREAGSRFQLSIWVADVDAVCAHLQQRGVTLLAGPVNRPWGMRTANFVDPAGHSWEVAQQLDS
ncbi:VOC family protein [Duganella sp. BJB1802]|uniref:VOC family protein n=1 Tax=Duganella sp. BJB1802 TaxID=2744575 RepID=UPI0015938368|nr:VOC family protein [Duganella sp. BJB1802]NVD72948.1 VOC family protein [Duganella sp. BJB1802]